MYVDPTLNEIVKGKRGMLAGIRHCLKAKCLVSAVTLIFSSIDALAALTRPEGQGRTTGHDFKAWVMEYMKPESELGCSPEEIWSSRCGVLHLYSPSSSCVAQNVARPMYFQWKSGPKIDASRPIPAGAYVVDVEMLFEVFKRAVQAFMIASEMNQEVKKRVATHLSSLHCYVPYPSE